MIHKIIPVGPLATNCHLIRPSDSGPLLIVDPGAEADLILAAAKEIPHTQARILLTHAHIDHISAAGEVAEKLGIKAVEVAPEDLPLYRDKRNCFLPYLPPAENLPPGIPFEEIPCCRILPLPGHTPGGTGFLFEDGGEKFLLAGDTIFSGSIGRTDLPGGDYETLLESIRTQIMTLPDDREIFPGHGGSTSVGFERENNPFIAEEK